MKLRDKIAIDWYVFFWRKLYWMTLFSTFLEAYIWRWSFSWNGCSSYGLRPGSCPPCPPLTCSSREREGNKIQQNNINYAGWWYKIIPFPTRTHHTYHNLRTRRVPTLYYELLTGLKAFCIAKTSHVEQRSDKHFTIEINHDHVPGFCMMTQVCFLML